MIIQVQPNFPCENCIKCGKRPQVEQQKKHWIISCPNKSCKNLVKSMLVDFTAWNNLNKQTTTISTKDQGAFKKTA